LRLWRIWRFCCLVFRGLRVLQASIAAHFSCKGQFNVR
jgi:hypothetical protein